MMVKEAFKKLSAAGITLLGCLLVFLKSSVWIGLEVLHRSLRYRNCDVFSNVVYTDPVYSPNGETPLALLMTV